MKKILLALFASAVLMAPARADISHMDISGSASMWGFYGDNLTDMDDSFDDDDAFAWSELYLTFSADLADNVMVVATLLGDFGWDGSNTTGDEADQVRIEELYVKIAGIYESNFDIVLGRQYLAYGRQVIVGDGNPGYPSLAGRGKYKTDPFDAAKIVYNGNDWTLDLVWAKAAETGIEDSDSDLYLAYFSYAGCENHVFDLYFAYVNDEAGMSGGNTVSYSSMFQPVPAFGDTDLFALGARAEGKIIDPLAYHVEAAFEFGDMDGIAGGTESAGTDDLDISTPWIINAGLDWTVTEQYNWKLFGEYTFLSGDDSMADGDYEAWVPLFENQTYGEIVDSFLSTNAHVFNLGTSVEPTDKLTLTAKYFYFLLDEDMGGDDNIGSELDGYIDYAFSEELSAQLAGGLFFPDDTEDISGGALDDDEAAFVRAMVTVTF